MSKNYVEKIFDFKKSLPLAALPTLLLITPGHVSNATAGERVSKTYEVRPYVGDSSSTGGTTPFYLGDKESSFDHAVLDEKNAYDLKTNTFGSTPVEMLIDRQALGDNNHIQKILLLKEILSDFISPADQRLIDKNINEGSFTYALEFLWALPESLGIPTYDVHPDGEFSLVWRNENVGILAISFSNDGDINYASYSPKTNIRHKGLLAFSDLRFNLPGHEKATEEDTILFTLIRKFS